MHHLHNEIAQFGHKFVVKFLVTVPGATRDRFGRHHIEQYIQLLGLTDDATDGFDQRSLFQDLQGLGEHVLRYTAGQFDIASPNTSVNDIEKRTFWLN